MRMLQQCASELEARGISTEVLSLAGKNMKGCQACGWCKEHPQEKRCAIQDDDFSDVFQ